MTATPTHRRAAAGAAAALLALALACPQAAGLRLVPVDPYPATSVQAQPGDEPTMVMSKGRLGMPAAAPQPSLVDPDATGSDDALMMTLGRLAK